MASRLDLVCEIEEQVVKSGVLEEFFHGTLGVLVVNFADDSESFAFVVVLEDRLRSSQVLLLFLIKV